MSIKQLQNTIQNANKATKIVLTAFEGLNSILKDTKNDADARGWAHDCAAILTSLIEKHPHSESRKLYVPENSDSFFNFLLPPHFYSQRGGCTAYVWVFSAQRGHFKDSSE